MAIVNIESMKTKIVFFRWRINSSYFLKTEFSIIVYNFSFVKSIGTKSSLLIKKLTKMKITINIIAKIDVKNESLNHFCFIIFIFFFNLFASYFMLFLLHIFRIVSTLNKIVNDINSVIP